MATADVRTSQFSNTKWLEEAKQVCTIHHAVSALLCVIFYLSKCVGPVCHALYGPEAKCYITEHEYQILLLLAFVIYTKNRKATSWYHYLSNVFLYTKVANFALFYWMGAVYGIVYAALAIAAGCIFPEPVFAGAEAVLYFRGNDPLQLVRESKSSFWLVELYANWVPMCQHFAAVFAKISVKYNLPNFKFGKLDVGRYPKDALSLGVESKLITKALPTLILFRNGKETKRYPATDSSGHVLPYHFTEENIIRDFDLNNIYLTCQKELKKENAKAVQRPKVE